MKFKAKDVIIKVGNGGSPESFTTIGALKTATINITGTAEDVTTKSSNGKRELLAGAGIVSCSVSGDGVFDDSAQMEAVRAAVFANSALSLQFVHGSNDMIAGSFLITNLTYAGAERGAETSNFSAESAGDFTYTAGS